jgi:hypothetical protein
VFDRRVSSPGERDSRRRVPEHIDTVPRQEIQDGISLEQYVNPPVDEDRIGISCSGGGIRSASFCLGALQILRREKVLEEAHYISAVSGGSYIAIAHAVAAGLTLQGGDPDNSEAAIDPDHRAALNAMPPFAAGSPEEKHLRDRSTYLAAGTVGKIWFIVNLLWGMLRHLLPFAAGIYALGLAFGWILSPWLGSSLRQRTSSLDPLEPVVWILVGLGAALWIALGIRRGRQVRSSPKPESLERLRRAATVLTITMLGVGVFFLALPALLLALPRLAWIQDRIEAAAAIQLSAVGVLTFIARQLRKGALIKHRKLYLGLIRVVTPLLGPLVLLAPFALTTYLGATRGFQAGSISAICWYASVAVIVYFWLFADEVTPSMHMFYRERLASAFVGYRQYAGDDQSRLDYEQPDWSKPLWLSKLARPTEAGNKLPELIVCAAVNVTSDVPPGRMSASFTFERERCGGPVTGYVPTSEFEQVATDGKLTLPGMMAISGAAVAPSMGRMTRASFRLLLALFNVRLGVWLPNPRRLQGVEDAGANALSRNGRKTMSALAEELSPRVRRPGALYLIKEALGINGVDDRFVYVSDGGHWENLGVVELLRRGCTTIICLDAAGDPPGQFHTLAGAVELARAELGVEIEFDTSDLVPDETGQAKSNCAEGVIRYPNGTEGKLYLLKTIIAHGAPLDVLSFRERDRRFPYHPTSDQLFDDRQFESYRALGRDAAQRFIKRFREPKSTSLKTEAVVDITEAPLALEMATPTVGPGNGPGIDPGSRDAPRKS